MAFFSSLEAGGTRLRSDSVSTWGLWCRQACQRRAAGTGSPHANRRCEREEGKHNGELQRGYLLASLSSPPSSCRADQQPRSHWSLWLEAEIELEDGAKRQKRRGHVHQEYHNKQKQKISRRGLALAKEWASAFNYLFNISNVSVCTALIMEKSSFMWAPWNRGRTDN